MMMANNEAAPKRGWMRIVILLVVVFAVAGVLAMKDRGDSPELETAPEVTEALPRMIDLGADKCIPCKTMAPILEKLKTDLAGQCDVTFIDVWKNPAEGPKYGIKVIPTQIFFDAEGQELFRHEGFFSREDILGTFRKHGITFQEI
jgi:thioredoxin